MLNKNKKNDFILVLIQTYNDGEYLVKAIKSLLNQTYKKLDILIVGESKPTKKKIEKAKKLQIKIKEEIDWYKILNL